MPTELVVRSSLAAVAVLGSTGVTIVVVEAARRRPLSTSLLATRWRTWVALAAIWILGLTSPAVLYPVLAVLGLAAASEYAKLAKLGWTDWLTLLALPVVGLSFVSLGFDPLAVVTGTLVASTIRPLLEQDVADGPRRVGQLLVGVTVVVVPVISMWVVSQSAPVLFVALLFGVALSDVTAFTVGSTLGRHPVAPELSPNKTWEGVAGNLAGAAVGVAIAGFGGGIGVAGIVLFAVAIAVGAVWGDLFESLLKRHADVKDAGTVLPGFGGILDRVDSLIVAAPLMWIVLQLSGGGL